MKSGSAAPYPERDRERPVASPDGAWSRIIGWLAALGEAFLGSCPSNALGKAQNPVVCAAS